MSRLQIILLSIYSFFFSSDKHVIFTLVTGDLKKLLAVKTALESADQCLKYKGKERGNKEFLDKCGVKNKSKLVLIEDPTSLEKRYIEMKKNARMQNIQRAISDVSFEVDRLADQVTITVLFFVLLSFLFSVYSLAKSLLNYKQKKTWDI